MHDMKHPPIGGAGSAGAPGSPTSNLPMAASAPAALELIQPGTDDAKELYLMINTLRGVHEVISGSWENIYGRTSSREQLEVLDNATLGLMRLASEFHTELVKRQVRVAWKKVGAR